MQDFNVTLSNMAWMPCPSSAICEVHVAAMNWKRFTETGTHQKILLSGASQNGNPAAKPSLKNFFKEIVTSATQHSSWVYILTLPRHPTFLFSSLCLLA